MAASTTFMILFLFSGLVSHVVFADEQCNGPHQASIHGKMLRGHTYDKRFSESGHAECLHTCRSENVCQSFNFVISTSVCELNSRTKEASPENFVDDRLRYYVKLDLHRVPLGSIPELPAKSCQEIKANEEGQVVSEKYWFYSIIPGTSVFAYCNMTTEDIDECSASPSACTNGDCENNDGSYVCTCHPGFTGNGKSCSDIDECRSGLHDCRHANAPCTNTAGSYSCAFCIYGNRKTRCQDARGLQTSSILNGSANSSIYGYHLASFLEPVLQDLARSRFVRCWRASSDGWAASTFHSRCDGKGPTVTIIRVGSYLFGGYTSLSWYSSTCGYASDNTAFIYSLYNIRGNDYLKMTVKPRDPSAIYRCSSYGPTFGGRHNIYVSNDAASNSASYAYCGYPYSLPTGYSCPFIGGGFYFSPTDVEVFYEKTG